ncbi:PDZ domain-containing protein [Pseudoxanthomonas mexicana]|uniref:PDZ domain-containing protein n=1 Tax=Pseudoxanthomonas mexicana TaxID=128785 RepID=UPI00398A535B
MKRLLSSPLLAGLVFALPATAAEPPHETARHEAARQQELADARAEMARAARRVAELAAAEAGNRRIDIEQRVLVGVLLAPDDEAGVRISGVTPGGGAAKAGLKAGDRLLAVEGKAIAGDSGAHRLESARKALARLQPERAIELRYQRDGRTHTTSVTPQQTRALALMLENAPRPAIDAELQEKLARLRVEMPTLIAPEVQRELRRLGSDDCQDGGACRLAVLADAFRWNGLNLAAVDARLGRYFGATRGVLVLSTSDDLKGLEAGDVIQRIGGKEVDTPREAMAILRGHPVGSQVAIDYLRDKRGQQLNLTLPKSTPLRIPLPPAPPAPPAPPTAATPRAPAAPPAPKATTHTIARIVTVDRDGHVYTEESDSELSAPLAPVAPPAPPPPPARRD